MKISIIVSIILLGSIILMVMLTTLAIKGSQEIGLYKQGEEVCFNNQKVTIIHAYYNHIGDMRIVYDVDWIDSKGGYNLATVLESRLVKCN